MCLAIAPGNAAIMNHSQLGVGVGVGDGETAMGVAVAAGVVGVGDTVVGVGAAPPAGCEVGVGACGVVSGAMGSSVVVATTAGVGLAVLAGSGCVGWGAALEGGHTQVMSRKSPSARLAQKRLSPGSALGCLLTRAASDGPSPGAGAGSEWLMRASLLLGQG